MFSGAIVDNGRQLVVEGQEAFSFLIEVNTAFKDAIFIFCYKKRTSLPSFFMKMKPKNLCCEIWRPRRLLPLLQAGLTRAYPCPMEPTFQRQG